MELKDKIIIPEKLKSFIIQETLVKEKEVVPSAEIDKDLGITGDDAVELIDNFSNEFNVDISGFEFDKYFQEEGSWFFGWLSDFFNKGERLPRIGLTINDLAEAVSTGKLT